MDGIICHFDYLGEAIYKHADFWWNAIYTSKMSQCHLTSEKSSGEIRQFYPLTN